MIDDERWDSHSDFIEEEAEWPEIESFGIKIRLTAADLVTMAPDHINGAPVVRRPQFVEGGDDGPFVEFYTGSEDGSYCRILILASMPIELETRLP